MKVHFVKFIYSPVAYTKVNYLTKMKIMMNVALVKVLL
jgi:hypothetical protein